MNKPMTKPMTRDMTAKVDVDLLDVSDDGTKDILLDGKLFSGIAYEHDDDSGVLIGLAGYSFGASHGPFRTWHPHGKIATEFYYRNGLRNGPQREWHKTGIPKLHSYWECDFCLWKYEWDEHGALSENFKLESESKYALKIRERLSQGTWKTIDIDVKTMEFFERPQGWGKDLPPEAEPG